MFISKESLQQIPVSYATCSIGCTNEHTLPRKLEAISTAGFTAIELAFPDIVDHASRKLGHPIAADNYPELTAVSKEIKELCQKNKLKIMMLQPFSNFEGWPRGSKERADALDRAHGWISVMQALGTDMLQVGSTDTALDSLSATRENIIADLRELADKLAQHNMRLAYENWCWSTHAPTWKDVWSIVEAVDRPNIGLCLDTFQTAGSEWGDPTTATGRVGDLPLATINAQFSDSMAALARTIPPEKIYLLQISDAYLPSPRIEARIVEGMWPRARWSHDFRPMPGDGGYLPIVEVGRAVFQTGFRGWFSMEIFDGGPEGKGKKYDMGEYAKEAMGSMHGFFGRCVE
ncbi:xylose isomerase-like protein [Aspergillus ambiguus]|uniref:sugar phosphate isomerase/epimerase family protein n=1 Tax=Aspergillus ambiguus TaxID=176160 RepID=UPI003CCD340F